MTLGERLGGPVGEQPGEVERLVELVGADEGGHRLDRLGPGLRDGHPVGTGLVEDLVPRAVDVVDLGLVPHRLVGDRALDHLVGAARGLAAGLDDLVAQRRLLEEAVGHVDPEAVDAAVEPEAQHVLEHRRDLGVAPVEVGLAGVEEVEVPLAVLDLGPRGAAEDGLPVVGGRAVRRRRGRGSARAPGCRGRRRARPGTRRARRRCGWAPGRRRRAGRARGPARSGRRRRRACRRAGRRRGSRRRRSRGRAAARCRTA